MLSHKEPEQSESTMTISAGRQKEIKNYAMNFGMRDSSQGLDVCPMCGLRNGRNGYFGAMNSLSYEGLEPLIYSSLSMLKEEYTSNNLLKGRSEFKVRPQGANYGAPKKKERPYGLSK